jgi:DNA replication protein DnaC
MLGNPGLGKTHLATSLALAACRQGYKVRFYTAAGLVNDLIQAQDDHRLPRVLAAALKQHLIVVDELGFIPFSPTGAHLMFQFCSSLYERVALIITTNLRFADWTQVFGDERLTAALLDRLTYRAHLLECVGESFRVRQRLQRDTQKHRG